MKSIIVTLGFIVILSGCEGTNNDGIPRFRSQRDADAYNATVSSEGEKIICEREEVIGSNIRALVCLTVNQRDNLARSARENIDTNVLR
ncbi:MAG: hypothetical protein CMP90_08410 [Gammaproteobacteria bacterium]|jgi:hypothetical protein|nr:hypothetical protein [Gammaproteobacteria bacterium]